MEAAFGTEGSCRDSGLKNGGYYLGFKAIGLGFKARAGGLQLLENSGFLTARRCRHGRHRPGSLNSER